MLSSLPPLHVAVIHGTISQEDALYRDAADPKTSSTIAIANSLERLGAKVTVLDISSSGFARSLARHDLAFPNMHGPYGEDGKLQGHLEYLGVPYVNSGVLASAVGMDKRVSKQIAHSLGLPVIPTLREHPTQRLAVSQERSIIKAVDGGSSVGISILAPGQEPDPALKAVMEQGFHNVLQEPFIEGPTATVPVIPIDGEPVALTPISVRTESMYYDAESKLRAGGKTTVSNLAEENSECAFEIQEQAVRVYRALRCSGAIRLDYIVSEKHGALFMELNTSPGLQPASNLVASAALDGYRYDDVICLLARDALQHAKMTAVA